MYHWWKTFSSGVAEAARWPARICLRGHHWAPVVGGMFVASPAFAQLPSAASSNAPPSQHTPNSEPVPEAEASSRQEQPKPEWYEVLKIRGYTQIRYNRLPSFDENESLVNDQGDKYIGAGSGFGIRRARVIIQGDVHPHVSVYLQTDFASAIDTQNHVAIVRDWYADLAVDDAKEFRLRVGQSKVPYGFENLQSSQNRLPFDRNDAINSAVKDERDLGVFAYWAPAETRQLFKHLDDANLKASGDYGVVGLGVYNGQTANRFDRNDNLHVVGRVSYPFRVGEQYVEVGVGGYTGLYTIKVEAPDGGPEYRVRDDDGNLRDARAIASAVIYPQPLGIQAEYNIGKGPQQQEENMTTIATSALHGGYAQVMLQDRRTFRHRVDHSLRPRHALRRRQEVRNQYSSVRSPGSRSRFGMAAHQAVGNHLRVHVFGPHLIEGSLYTPEGSGAARAGAGQLLNLHWSRVSGFATRSKPTRQIVVDVAS